MFVGFIAMKCIETNHACYLYSSTIQDTCTRLTRSETATITRHCSFGVTAPKFWEVTANTYPEGVPLGSKQKSEVLALQPVFRTRFFYFFFQLARSQVIFVANSRTRMV